MPFYNNVRQLTSTTGTGDTIALGSVYNELYQTLAQAGAVAGETAHIKIEEGLDWAIYFGTVGASATSFDIVTVRRSKIAGVTGTTRLTLAGAATVRFIESAEDLNAMLRFDVAQTFTAPQKAVALRNIGAAQYGLVNGKIVETNNGTAATYALKGLDGNDPSATNPVLAIFQDGTQISVEAATSITITSGATLNVTSALGFNTWVGLVNDAGTARLAVRNCSDASGFYGFPANGILSSTAVSSGADSAGVTYTGTAVTDKSFIIVGFFEYRSGLAAAGTWNASPTRFVKWFPGMPLPGDMIQSKTGETSTSTNTASGTMQNTNLTVSLTPTSQCNPIEIAVDGSAQINSGGGSSQYGAIAIQRSGVTLGARRLFGVGSNNLFWTLVSFGATELPNSTSNLTWTTTISSPFSTSTTLFPTDTAYMTATERQG